MRSALEPVPSVRQTALPSEGTVQPTEGLREPKRRATELTPFAPRLPVELGQGRSPAHGPRGTPSAPLGLGPLHLD